jgi:hypothetical protein
LFVCACASSETLAQRKAVRGAEVTGTFRSYFRGKFKGSYNEILILALGGNKLKIEMDLVYPYQVNGEMTANLGSASGEAMIEGDTAVFTPEDAASASCKITLKFSRPGTLIVTTENNIDCGFGHNVSADGTYKKTSGAKPKFGATQPSETRLTTSRLQKWRTAIYQGITLGKSTKADVYRIFGKPRWSGSPEDEYDNPVGSLLSFEYDNVGSFNGGTCIIMRRRSGVVIEIYLYPAYQAAPTLPQIVDEYGAGYIERESCLGPCPTAREIKKYKPSEEKNIRCSWFIPGEECMWA